MFRSLLTTIFAVLLISLLAAPVLAQGRGNDDRGNSGGNSGNSGNDNRGNSGNSGASNTQAAQASSTPTRTTTSSSLTSSTPTVTAGATATPAADDKDRGKDDKDKEKDDKDNHGASVSGAAQDARDSSTGPGRGREVSDAARSALGKPEQAVVSVAGVLASIAETQAIVVGLQGEIVVTLTPETRIKTKDDSDATVSDLVALLADGTVPVRVRGRVGTDGSVLALRLEVRHEGDTVTVELDGVIDALSATGFTLVTRAATAPTGTTATTTTAPTGTTATTASAPTGATATSTTTIPTGTTATSTVAIGGTYAVLVTTDTTIRRNDVSATLSALRAGDEVEARGTLDGTTLTATRVLADGPAPSGTTATTTAPTGTTATTTAGG